MTLLAAADTGASDTRLVLAAILGIAVVVVLITWLKVHPFLALILGSLLLGIVAGLAFTDTIASFQAGVGATVGNVGVLIALGAMIGGLLAESGGADRVVNAFVDRVSAAPAALGDGRGRGAHRHPAVLRGRRRPARADRPARGPAHAGCRCSPSASRRWPACPCCTAWCRRTPGRWSPSTPCNADLGRTLLFGLICAIPCVILAGPVFGSWISRRLDLPVPVMFGQRENVNATAAATGRRVRWTTSAASPPVDSGRRSARRTAVSTAVRWPPVSVAAEVVDRTRRPVAATIAVHVLPAPRTSPGPAGRGAG